jgi:hypothetical protein
VPPLSPPPPPCPILQNQGKTVVLPVLHPMARAPEVKYVSIPQVILSQKTCKEYDVSKSCIQLS